MRRSTALQSWVLLLLAAGLLLALQSCSGGDGHPSSSSGKIQHVVVIFQENRTPDNLFHDPVLISRGADIASMGVKSQGQTIPLRQIDLAGVAVPGLRGCTGGRSFRLLQLQSDSASVSDDSGARERRTFSQRPETTN
jgi:hypothetical protein